MTWTGVYRSSKLHAVLTAFSDSKLDCEQPSMNYLTDSIYSITLETRRTWIDEALIWNGCWGFSSRRKQELKHQAYLNFIWHWELGVILCMKKRKSISCFTVLRGRQSFGNLDDRRTRPVQMDCISKTGVLSLSIHLISFSL